MELCLERGADVNLVDEEKQTALTHAITSGSVDVVELLLEHGADPNFRCAGGISPLFHAILIAERSARLIEILLEHKADVLALCSEDATILGFSSRMDSTSFNILIDHMVKEGQHKNLDARGDSALHLVCQTADRCIRTLLDNGLGPNLRNTSVETPLHVATKSGRVNTVRILLDRGADVSARTEEDGLMPPL